MFATPIDLATPAVVIAGAPVAGYVTGLAGFATALGSGLWFHALPAAAIPPLVALSSVAAQIVGLITVQKALDWSRASPYLAGGALGVPLGTVALAAASRSCSEHPWRISHRLSVGMAVSGQIIMPMQESPRYAFATLLGAWIGAHVYVGLSAQTFQRVVLGLLLASGCILLVRGLTITARAVRSCAMPCRAS